VSRIKLKSPHHHSESVLPEPDSKKPIWLVAALFVALLILVTSGIIFFLLGPKRGQMPEALVFNVERFSGNVSIYSRQKEAWIPLSRTDFRGTRIGPGDLVKTANDADIDLRVPTLFEARIKPDSEVEVLESEAPRSPGFFAGESDEVFTALTIRLSKGGFLGLTREAFQNKRVEVQIPNALVRSEEASFFIRVLPKNTIVSVLDGAMEVEVDSQPAPVRIPSLHSLVITRSGNIFEKPKRLTYQSWRAVNEVRDLVFETQEEAEKQVDLRQKAGSLFKYVFDEGTFFTPNLGFAKREFFEDEHGDVLLKIDYDVYPQNALVGTYMKTRELDLSKVDHMSFEMKAAIKGEKRELKPENIPKMIRIELKKRSEIIRGFAVKPITTDWRLYSFDLPAQKEELVNEVVFVFENTRIGTLSRKGAVLIKNLTIE